MSDLHADLEAATAATINEICEAFERKKALQDEAVQAELDRVGFFISSISSTEFNFCSKDPETVSFVVSILYNFFVYLHSLKKDV